MEYDLEEFVQMEKISIFPAKELINNIKTV